MIQIDNKFIHTSDITVITYCDTVMLCSLSQEHKVRGSKGDKKFTHDYPPSCNGEGDNFLHGVVP